MSAGSRLLRTNAVRQISDLWRVRAEALPLSRVISVEAKTYTGEWRIIDPFEVCLRHPGDPELPSRGVLLNGVVYSAVQNIQTGWILRIYIIKKNVFG